MKASIKSELNDHINNLIVEGVLTSENREDWHFHAFNEDHYIIGYHQCSEWLKNHGMGEFDAAAICTEYEIDNFGELGKVYTNSEQVVNMLVYIYGEELINERD